MKKPISTRTHGMIDYAYAAALIALPFVRGWHGRPAQLSIGAGLATLGLSMLTNYEYGLLRLIPMQGHLAMDAAESSMLMAAPKMLGNGNREASRVLAAMGAIGGAVGSMTQLQPRPLLNA
jgi:hypothetical protein